MSPSKWLYLALAVALVVWIVWWFRYPATDDRDELP